ncbi:crossover junction endodeoxyribonuclease RuvC [Shimazuella kribbensis]|uniref:crossover junction endodeoxyribonuclease RuvC n=1 Tax=Shimazuella kribbensis TaxID=139808 RepID=UPI00042057A7|nr:crossover junction endodeoxyribonuclease RuvC [Shimazuella kribbensis]
MKIIGIDPGIAIVGYSVLTRKGNKLVPIDYGSIETPAGMPTPKRLKEVYDASKHLFQLHQPDVMTIEKLFFNRNVTNAFTVSAARGVIMLAAEECGIPITEYTPLQVKMAVTGFGKAEKTQVQKMVQRLLHLPAIPKPDDVADALAIAICEVHAGAR